MKSNWNNVINACQRTNPNEQSKKKIEQNKKKQYWMNIRKLNKNNPTIAAKRKKRVEEFLQNNPDYLDKFNT